MAEPVFGGVQQDGARVDLDCSRRISLRVLGSGYPRDLEHAEGVLTPERPTKFRTGTVLPGVSRMRPVCKR
jgi:hypothetical protein